MSNSMDDIIIRYSDTVLTTEEAKKIEKKIERIEKSNVPENLRKIIYPDFDELLAKRPQTTDVTLKEFLSFDPKELSPFDADLQKILAFLYNENGKDTPVYKKFPNREKPLVIDCSLTIPKGNDSAGLYFPTDNKIILKKEQRKLSKLLETVTHELKHAEISPDLSSNLNSYQKHQLEFLNEALAYACGVFVKNRYFDEKMEEKEHLTEKQLLFRRLMGFDYIEPPHLNMASENAAEHFEYFMKTSLQNSYKEKYDKSWVILYTDKGVTQIPESFGIDKKDMVHLIKKMNALVPHEAMYPSALFWQTIANNDIKKLSKLLSEKDECEKDGYYMRNDEIKQATPALLSCFLNKNDKKEEQAIDCLFASGRLTKDDFKDLLSQTAFISYDEELTQGKKEARLKIFNKIISQKNEKGKPVLSEKEIRAVLHSYDEISEVFEEQKEISDLFYKTLKDKKASKQNGENNKFPSIIKSGKGYE